MASSHVSLKLFFSFLFKDLERSSIQREVRHMEARQSMLDLSYICEAHQEIFIDTSSFFWQAPMSQLVPCRLTISMFPEPSFSCLPHEHTSKRQIHDYITTCRAENPLLQLFKSYLVHRSKSPSLSQGKGPLWDSCANSTGTWHFSIRSLECVNEGETLPKDALYERWEETTISQLRAATDGWTDHHHLSWDSRVDATAQGQEAGSYNTTFNVCRFTLEIPQPVN